MKISCPTCSAKYSIADDKVQDRLAKIRCRKCGATIVIDGKTSPPSVYASASDGDAQPGAAAGGGGSEYSVDLGEGDQRTMSTAEIVQAYNAGQITGDTYVWAEGFTDWQPLAEVSDLVDALNAAASRVSATSRQPSPWSAPPAAPAEPAPAAFARPAAARSPARPAASDLFGGIHTAGNEDEVATSAPEQLAPAAGARNESSVLFSLSALTSAAQHSRPSTRPQPAASASHSREDSGLIDLKALTAAATQAEAAAAPMLAPPMSPLGAPPLGSMSLGLPGPTLGGLAGSADIGMPPKSKVPLLIGGGLTVGLLAVAAAILLKPEPAPPPPPAPVVTMPAAPAPPPTTAATDPEPAASAAPDASADKKSARPSGRRYGPRKSTPKSDPGSAAATGGDEKKAPPKKSSNCGCSPSDLECNMRCSARGG